MTRTVSRKPLFFVVIPHLMRNPESKRMDSHSFSARNDESERQFPAIRESVLQPTAYSLQPGLSLIELLIAIGIMGVSMMLIAAAFPAGVAMSIAVSDETTAQAVFQEALSQIKDQVVRSEITPDASNNLVLLPDSAFTDPAADEARKFDQGGIFSWAALIRPFDDTANGPKGKLCQVVIVVSRKPSGSADFKDGSGATGPIPELRSVPCINSDPNARTITVDSGVDPSESPLTYFQRVPSETYMIDGQTGITYTTISRNDDETVTVLSEPPDDVNTDPRDFWLIPGPYDGSDYGLSSPGIRVFQAMLYLP